MSKRKARNSTLIIGKTQYSQLEMEARKRALSAGDYLEVLIEMDSISNTGSDPGEKVAVSISEKHYSLLCRDAEANGFEPEKNAEMIIGASAEMLPERPLSREKFDAVVEAWGGIDFPDGEKNEEKKEDAHKRGNSVQKASS